MTASAQRGHRRFSKAVVQSDCRRLTKNLAAVTIRRLITYRSRSAATLSFASSKIDCMALLRSDPAKLATVLSGLWVVLIIFLVAKTVYTAPSFEATALKPCPDFYLPIAGPVERAIQRWDSRLFFPFVRWEDALSREHITPFRKGETSLRCGTMEGRATLFLLGAKAGTIVPRVSVHWRALVALLILPCCLFVLGSYVATGRWRSNTARS